MHKFKIFLLINAAMLFSCRVAYIETNTPGPNTSTPTVTPTSLTPTLPTSITQQPGTRTPTPLFPTFTPYVVTATYTHTPFVPTDTLMPVCTPPACGENESYFCPGTCVGGCGTVCATHTPTQPPDWWKPQSGLTFHIQFSGEIDLNQQVDVYDLDLFDTVPETIDQLHGRGVKVMCYFSAGSFEDWRPDADQFPQNVLGDPLPDWPGERWLDIRRIDLLGPIMSARLDLAALSGCDAVDPDNLDGYANSTGFSLTPVDQLTYNRWLAEQAHQRGLSIGLKNDLGQTPALVKSFDFAVNEECYFYQECELLQPFINGGKAVFGIEYELKPQDFCPQSNAAGYMFVVKNRDLDAFQIPCWEH